MSQEGEAVVKDNVVTGESEAVVQQPQTNETEAKARSMGWVDKDEFRGDPEKWRPADEFVERGENMVPLLRDRVKRQEKELSELKRTMHEFAEFHSKTAQREYAKAYADLESKQAAAIAAGDGAAFLRVGREIKELETEMGANAQKVQNPQEQQIPAAEFNAWLSRNPWANDIKLQNVGRAIGESLVAEGETARGVELLDLVAKEIKQLYPQKFENPRRNAAPSVEGAGSAPRKAGKTYADLPPEAKEACDRFTKQKLMTRDAYVKSFFEE